MASQPHRQVLPQVDQVDPPGADCPEALAPAGVRVRSVGPTSTLFTFDNGTQMLIGRHPDEFTNVATGKSVVLQLQGMAVTVPHADGTADAWASGTIAFTFFPGDVGPGDQSTVRTYAFTGHIRLAGDNSGAVVAFSSTGKVDDVCAMIA